MMSIVDQWLLKGHPMLMQVANMFVSTFDKKKGKNNVITLERVYKDGCTLSSLTFPTGVQFKCIELPWQGNKQYVSCIPEGTYTLSKRQSGVVRRTSNGKYQEGWEVTCVKGRSYIMFHIANTVDDLEGCIGVGTKFGSLNGKEAVLQSSNAFDEFMAIMENKQEWTLQIKEKK